MCDLTAVVSEGYTGIVLRDVQPQKEQESSVTESSLPARKRDVKAAGQQVQQQ